MRHDKYILVDKKAIPFEGCDVDTEEGRKRLSQWAELAYGTDRETRRVGRDIVGDYLVSTVFLGLNHNFSDGPPHIFETMVFDHGKNKGDDIYMERCSTWEEAEEQHKRIVEKIKSGEIPERN